MKITYWISTLLVSIFLLWSSYSYLFNKATIKGVLDLGFPDFFRIQLVVLKIIATLIILIPLFSVQVKDWAYAGIFFFFVTAIIAHTVHKDSFIITLINLFLIALLLISRFYLTKN